MKGKDVSFHSDMKLEGQFTTDAPQKRPLDLGVRLRLIMTESTMPMTGATVEQCVKKVTL